MKTDPTSANPSPRFKTFATIACVSAALMALFWSLDAFFVYLFGGVALAFGVLAMVNRPQPPVSIHQRARSWERPRPKQPGPKTTSTGKISARQIIAGLVILVIAFGLLEALSDSNPDDYSYYYQIAEDFRNAAEYDSAKYYYRKALSREEHADAYLSYGNILLLDLQYDSAIIYYDQVTNIDPDYVNAYYNKAVARYNQNRYDESRQYIRQTLALDAANPDALALMGDNFYATQKSDSALYYYEQAHSYGASGAWISHVMAYLYDTKGDRNNAIEFYKDALYYDSSKVEIYPRLAELIGGREGELYRTLGYKINR